MKGNISCVKYVLTVFFNPIDTLRELKVNKAFILLQDWCTAKLSRKYKSSVKVCPKISFTKNSYHVETSQL